MNLLDEITNKIERKRDDYSILFIHGIASNFSVWKTLLKSISNNNYYEMRFKKENELYHNFDCDNIKSLWNISYYSKRLIKECLFGNLDTYSKRLEKIINTIIKLTGKKKVIIVAHSMGGLVSRKFMTLSQSNWDCVHKILTIGTPNNGVNTSINLVGQLRDLKNNSNFINRLNNDWDKMYNDKKWGVIGSINNKSLINITIKNKYKTDSAGPGYVAISSSIPYGEWEDAIDKINIEVFDSEHFGFRLATSVNHRKLLNYQATLKGILWALE